MPLLFMVALISACTSGSEEGSSDAFAIEGSIGDGPIVDADIVLIDAEGTEVGSGRSDSSANYQIDVPRDAVLPVTVRVTGGTDLVTQRAADFELIAMVNNSGRQTINVSPLTTLAVRAAQCRGEADAAGIEQSWDAIAATLNIGLDTSELGDPMTQRIDVNNIETAVLANEALGEWVRRVGGALPGVSLDQVIETLACDLANGRIDGDMSQTVTADDARLFAVAKAAEAAIRLEVLAGQLAVDGTDSTSAMNSAITTIMPELSSPDVNSVSVDGSAITGALEALTVLTGVFADSELADLVEVLAQASPGNVAAALDNALSAAVSNTLTGLVDRMAVADAGDVNSVVDRANDQQSAMPPVVAFAASPSMVTSGQASLLSWSSTNSERCSASWSSSDVALEGTFNTGALQQTTTYTLVCAGLAGLDDASVTVSVGQPEPQPEPEPEPQPEPEPTASISVSESEVSVGANVQVSWSSTNANTCAASGGWSGTQSTQGQQTVGPISGDTTFTVTCTGAGGSAVAMVSVTALGTMEFSWQAPTQNTDGSALTDLASYRIHYGQTSGSYSAEVVIDAGTESHSMTAPVGGYYIAMTAIDASGTESTLSNEIQVSSN